MPRSARIRLVALAVSVPLTLTACGDDDDAGSASSTTPAASAPAASATPTATASPSAAETSPSASETASATASGSASPAAPVAIGCDEAKGKVVGYSEPLPDPNFQAIEAIMKKHLGQFGAELRPVNANLNPGKQISDIQSLIQAKVAVLIANPVDPNATKPAFDAARKAGIPVIAQETKIGGPFFSNVGADVEAAAAGGAEVLAEMAKGGKVAAVLGPPFAEVLVRENTAFKAKAKELGIDVVEEKVNQQITPQAAKGFADAWKQKYGADLKGVWTFNDVSAIGVASSIGGTFNPVIASINAQPDALPLVKAGKIAATFDIQQDKLAQALAYAALAAICGQDAPEEIVIPVKRVDKSNVDSHRPLSERVNDEFKVEFEERDGRTFMKTD